VTRVSATSGPASSPASNHKSPHWPPVREPEPTKPTPKMRRPDGAGSPLLDKVCLIAACAWMIVLVLCLLSLLVTIVFENTQPSVLLTDLPDLASGNDMLMALAFSALLGIGTARLMGGSTARIILRAIGLMAMLFMMLLVPMIVTSQQIIQAWTFSGRTTHSIQSFRIVGTEAYQGKGGWRYTARINPDQCQSCIPSVNIDQAAYHFIVEHGGDPQAIIRLQYFKTNLCITANTERAGRSERLLLADRASWTVDDIKPCPFGAR
jgi:hypothetical protein